MDKRELEIKWRLRKLNKWRITRQGKPASGDALLLSVLLQNKQCSGDAMTPTISPTGELTNGTNE